VSAASPTVSGGNDDNFVISASPTNHTQATVHFTMSGGAQQGVDYTLSPSGSVTIPAGQPSANVTLHALTSGPAHKRKNKAKTAIFNLQNGSGYKVGSPKKATISIQGQ